MDIKDLTAELLFKPVQKEEESRELCVQVETLEVIVAVTLRNTAQNDQQRLIDQVGGVLHEVEPDINISDGSTELLYDYVKKLLRYPRQ